MIHPGYPTGGATGALMKDYRGKDANQVIWKFDSALASRIADNLKQAAIEEGQWTEKRDYSCAVPLTEAVNGEVGGEEDGHKEIGQGGRQDRNPTHGIGVAALFSRRSASRRLS
jgi:hypothetical protein